MNPTSSFVPNANSQYLFNRAYVLNIGAPKQTRALQYGTIPQFGGSPAPLRVRFDIEKTMSGSSANHSKIEIYGLSQQSRMNIKKGYLVQLFAGYDSLVGLLFTGNVFIAKSERKESSLVTCLECLDGGSAITYARLDKSYPAGVKLTAILSDLAAAMSLVTVASPVGVTAGISYAIPNPTYNNGFVAHGSCASSLNRLLRAQGLEWNVQNGSLNVIPIKSYDGTAAQVLSGETGLIGTPSQNQYFTQFTSLLNPKIVPGCLVKLVSENTSLNNYYKVRKCKYEGDSRENKWQVTCEATIQANVVQQTNLSGQGFNYDTAVVA